MTRRSVWPALGILGVALALPLVVRAADTMPAELEAYKQAQGRFRQRAGELEADTRAYLDEREAEERAKLSSGYDAAISQLEMAERSQRGLTIERFEDFLLRYPDAPYASHVRFRLADLYWEEAQEEWLAAAEQYEQLVQRLESEGRIEEIPPDPKMDLARVADLYRKIVADNESLPPAARYEFFDGALYMLGFLYNDERSVEYDPEGARSAFEKLLVLAPDSPLADEAHLVLGNFLFDESKLDEAIEQYWVIYEKGPESPLYSDAMYQLAWAYYKLSIYDAPRPGEPADATALTLFSKLLDHSEQEFLDSGKRSDYAPDATKFMAFSFADMAERQLTDPTEVAQAYFAKLGEPRRKYERAVYIALGDALTQYSRYDQAVNVYRKLQKPPWQFEPENPEFQMQVVKLLASGSTQDLAASAAARIELTEWYNDKSDWWQANRHNPEALATARRFIEESLADVAIEYRRNADQDKNIESYQLAAEKFREYLERFPISDDYFQMQWYLADTLYRAKDFEGATQEYGNLIRSRNHHPYGDGAVYQLMLASLNLAEQKHGPLKALPPDAEVEQSATTKFGKELTIYKLSAEHRATLETVDTALAHPFATEQTDPKQPNWSAELSKNRAALMYTVAEMQFRHNRFEEARPRLFDIIAKMPTTNEASYAAGLIVDSYNAEGDLENVRKYSGIYSKMQLGSPDLAGRGAVFADIEQKAAFNQAIAYVDAGEREKAADAFMQFLADFPNAPADKAMAALYNAANNYDIVGKAEKSNQLFEQYVQKYPKDEKSAQLYLRIAGNYESVLELNKAIDYYNRLVTNFPNNEFAADARYNAAFLRVGIGDHLGAAQGFEAYARTYSDMEDAESVYFMAGEQYELVSASKAIAFYEGYLSKYGTTNPEHALTAEYQLAQLHKSSGNTKKYNQWMDRLLTDFDAIVAAGVGDRAGEGRNHAAESAFRAVQAEYDKLTAAKMSGNDERDAKLIVDKEAEVVSFRERSLAIATKYGDFEYTSAILYLNAKSILYYADLGFQVRPPSGLSEDEEAAFMEILENEVYPKFYEYQDLAKEELQQLTQLGRDRKQHSDWVSKAYEDLNKLDPFSFPAEKAELRGGTDSSSYPEIRPMTSEPNAGTP